MHMYDGQDQIHFSCKGHVFMILQGDGYAKTTQAGGDFQMTIDKQYTPDCIDTNCPTNEDWVEAERKDKEALERVIHSANSQWSFGDLLATAAVVAHKKSDLYTRATAVLHFVVDSMLKSQEPFALNGDPVGYLTTLSCHYNRGQIQMCFSIEGV